MTLFLLGLLIGWLCGGSISIRRSRVIGQRQTTFTSLTMFGGELYAAGMFSGDGNRVSDVMKWDGVNFKAIN